MEIGTGTPCDNCGRKLFSTERGCCDSCKAWKGDQRGIKDEWLCGYAAALAAVRRLHHEAGIVVSVMRADGFAMSKFREAGVERFDMMELEMAVMDQPDLRKRMLKP